MSKIIGHLEGQSITLHDDGHLSFLGDMDIDCDGSGGNPDHDPCFQPDTTLHDGGKPLNAQIVPFIVVPPKIRNAVRPVVLGCAARVTDTRTGKSCLAVVGDIGPRTKIGEASPACAKLLGINPNSNHGGVDEQVIRYEIWPGVPAVIDGHTYHLQAA